MYYSRRLTPELIRFLAINPNSSGTSTTGNLRPSEETERTTPQSDDPEDHIPSSQKADTPSLSAIVEVSGNRFKNQSISERKNSTPRTPSRKKRGLDTDDINEVKSAAARRLAMDRSARMRENSRRRLDMTAADGIREY